MSKRMFFPLIAACAILVLLAACGSSASVCGTMTYLQKIALPDDAIINVQIQDTSLADAPATVIGEQVIQTEGKQVPLEYKVEYDPGDIQDNHS